MSILITGGAGFIGSHLVEELIKRDEEIVVLDDLSSGKIENIPESDKVIFIEGSITDRKLLRELFSFYNFSSVFHLAAVPSVVKSVENPVETHHVNCDGTIYLLEEIKSTDAVFVFASSAAVYGDYLKNPKKEDMPVNPLTPYAVDKYASERYTLNSYTLYGTKSVALRFFNVYGERQDPSSPYSGVISIFIDRIKRFMKGEKTEIIIYGDGKQTRDFIYVKDVVKAMLLVYKNEKAYGNVFNVGTGSSASLLELLEILKDITGKIPPVKFAPERKGDIKHSCADISKIEEIGFRPDYSLKEGLKKLLKYEEII
ncbi:NAD-dependent epimerase/dehydratase family protein [Persephonella atlantica]|uniref:NAD-dependent epimerase/dehydratase family protein n=1 Tax=Persephonella atlantica TaxID=2699429 RepID=A0ABS1GHC8_9AQUI|nr:NAD-dependent epimerase/dehydratase family protein [Persephonella atlantica]MBK3332329.1 NAD-dependent epimerase/dehydratase family protein [Persephonella atlantica]